jgi:hypothetical protein
MATQPGQLTEMAADIRAMSQRAENEDIREQLLEIAADLDGVINRIQRWQSRHEVGARVGTLAGARAED